jgi:hypothetical protein
VRRRRQLFRFGVAMAAVVLVVVALVFGGPRPPDSSSLGGERKASIEPREDSYSGLVEQMEKRGAHSVVVDAGTSKAKAVYDDGRYVEIALPADHGALLRQLAASGADVAIEGKGWRRGSRLPTGAPSSKRAPGGGKAQWDS